MTNPSRMLIILHPNTSRFGIILTDKFFNNEKYSFSRDKPASGHEERMLKRLMNMFAIKQAEAGRNELSIEIQDGFNLNEFMPQVIEIVREFTGPDYAKELFLEDRREDPNDRSRWDEDGYLEYKGTKMTGADIGIEYQVWTGTK